MNRRNTDEVTTESDSSTGPGSPLVPLIDLCSPATMKSVMPNVIEEKTVQEGLRETKEEMNGLSITEKLARIHAKVASHATASTHLSGAIRNEMKEYHREIVDTTSSIGIIRNNISTIEHLVLAVKTNLKGAEDTLNNVRTRFESTVRKIRERGHTKFAVRLVEFGSSEMEASLANLGARNSFLEIENTRLQTELENLKPKLEIDLTKIEPLYRPLADVQNELLMKDLSLPRALSVSIEPIPMCSKDLVKEESKPEIKMEIKPEVKSEMIIKTVPKSRIELVRQGKELLQWEEEMKKDEEYKRQAAMAQKIQKQKQLELAQKKEEAARKSSEDSIASNYDESLSTPGTYKIRRIDDVYEIHYQSRESGQMRSAMLKWYGNTNWALMNIELLTDLLPDVTCVCFKYGNGFRQVNESLTVHVDLRCNFSHVSSEMLMIPPIPCETTEIRLNWGPYTRIKCQTYIDLQLSDPSEGKANHVERFYVVTNKEYPEFDIHRVTVGRGFAEKYLKSKRASYSNGEMLWADDTGYCWRSTYQQKRGKR